MTSSAQPDRRPALSLAGIELDRLALPGLVASVLASGFLLYHLTRGTSFYVDDWNFITGRRGDTVATFLAPYQGHLSVVPIAIYRLMFAAFGISSYAPYRALVIALSLIVGLLVYDYARHRVGDFIAMLTAALILFLGPGWQDTMWAFQIAWLLALGAGIAALIMLDRRTLATDIAACALTLAAICSTSFGVAFAIGIAADIALTRRRWRDAWIPAIPLLLYAIWALHYHPTGIQWSAITHLPSRLLQSAAGGAASLVGLSGTTPLDAHGTTLVFGVPLVALLALVAVGRALRGAFGARAITLVVVLVAFATLTTVGRSFETPLVSRYVYVDAVLIALFCVELARGTRPATAIQAGLAVAALLAVISNVGVMRAAGAFLRQAGAQTDAALAVVELDRGHVPADTPIAVAEYPFMRLLTGQYARARSALGTPADTAGELLSTGAPAQASADRQLLLDGDARLSRSPAVRTVAARARVVNVAGGVARSAGGCIAFVPTAAAAPGVTGAVTLSAGPGALVLRATGAPATVSVARFAPQLTELGGVAQGRAATLELGHVPAPGSWLVQLTSDAPVRACAPGPAAGG